MTAEGCTLKIGNQKNELKNVSFFHEANGDPYMYPVRTLGRRYCYIRRNRNKKTYLLAYWTDRQCCDVTDQDTRNGMKAAGRGLDYPVEHGIDID